MSSKTIPVIQPDRAQIRISPEMLQANNVGSGLPALLMMPFLGGTQAEWTETVSKLSPAHRCITVDLPGFGKSSEVPGYSVEAMADQVIETLLGMKLDVYVFVAHSMAGKVSAVVTRKLLNNPNLAPAPAGIVLVSPSPPGPEPMTDAKRAEMLSMFGPAPREGDGAAASLYISENVSAPLPEPELERTTDGVLQTNRAAWAAWLERGSKEDWSEFVKEIPLPTLLVAGTHDGALGPAAQRKSTLCHFPAAKLIELDCGHLAPLEQPGELAKEIGEFMSKLTLKKMPETPDLKRGDL